MKQALVIAEREIREKSRILLVSAAVATLPFLGALLPTSRGHRLEVIAVMGGFLAAALGLGVAVALGVTVVGNELAQRRMSFYFARPLSASSVWIGKAGASILISLAAFLVIALPAWLVSPKSWVQQWTVYTAIPWPVGVAIVVLFLVSHTLASTVRSRSGVLGIDFVMLTVTAAALALMGRPLLLGGAMETAGILGLVFAGAFVLILSIAPAWQLERGRADARRSHAELSRFVWTATAVVLLILGAFVFWFVSVTPADIAEVGNVHAINPEWVWVTGTFDHRGDYTTSFLVHGGSGKYQRVGAPTWWVAQSSGDGRTVAVLRRTSLWPGGKELELILWKLDGAEATPAETGLRVTWPYSLGLSRDGSRLVLIHDGRLSVHDLASGRILAAAPWEEKKDPARTIMFLTNDLVRIFEGTGSSNDLSIFEMNIPARSLRRTGTAPGGARHLPMLTGSRDGTRLLPRGASIVFDGRTGATLAELPPLPEKQRWAWASAMLNDGSVVTITREGDRAELRQFSREGIVMRAIPLPGIYGGVVVAETSDGRIIVNVRSWDKTLDPRLRQTLVVDLEQAKVVQRIDQVYTPWYWPAADPSLPVYPADAWMAGLDSERRLVSWNLATGKRR